MKHNVCGLLPLCTSLMAGSIQQKRGLGTHWCCDSDDLGQKGLLKLLKLEWREMFMTPAQPHAVEGSAQLISQDVLPAWSEQEQSPWEALKFRGVWWHFWEPHSRGTETQHFLWVPTNRKVMDTFRRFSWGLHFKLHTYTFISKINFVTVCHKIHSSGNLSCKRLQTNVCNAPAVVSVMELWWLSVWHSKFIPATPITVVAIQIFPSLFYNYYYFISVLSSWFGLCFLPSTLIMAIKRFTRLLFCP